MFRTRSGTLFRLSVKLPLRRGRSDDFVREVVVCDLRGVFVGIEGASLQKNSSFVDSRRSLASVSWWVDSVSVA